MFCDICQVNPVKRICYDCPSIRKNKQKVKFFDSTELKSKIDEEIIFRSFCFVCFHKSHDLDFIKFKHKYYDVSSVKTISENRDNENESNNYNNDNNNNNNNNNYNNNNNNNDNNNVNNNNNNSNNINNNNNNNNNDNNNNNNNNNNKNKSTFHLNEGVQDKASWRILAQQGREHFE